MAQQLNTLAALSEDPRFSSQHLYQMQIQPPVTSAPKDPKFSSALPGQLNSTHR